MDIEHDLYAHRITITLNRGVPVRHETGGPGVMLGYDVNGRLLAIELHGAAAAIEHPHTVTVTTRSSSPHLPR